MPDLFAGAAVSLRARAAGGRSTHGEATRTARGAPAAEPSGVVTGTIGAMTFPDRPRLRGLFHQYAFVASLAAGVMLIAPPGGARARLPCAVFAGALVAVFGAGA